MRFYSKAIHEVEDLRHSRTITIAISHHGHNIFQFVPVTRAKKGQGRQDEQKGFFLDVAPRAHHRRFPHPQTHQQRRLRKGLSRDEEGTVAAALRHQGDAQGRGGAEEHDRPGRKLNRKHIGLSLGLKKA